MFQSAAKFLQSATTMPDKGRRMTQKLVTSAPAQVRAVSGRPETAATLMEVWQGLSAAVVDTIADDWYATEQKYSAGRQEHYFSAEFLMGRALLNNLSNLGMVDEAREVARAVGYPLLVRPSYVLGGRGMAIVYGEEELATYMAEATQVSPDHPVYLDAFLEDAIELDVDALADGTECYVGSVLEHIEECGIHSGDSACCYPPFSLSDAIVGRVREITRRLALAVGVRGPLNIQYAVKDEQVLVIEMNPRASRTVPFSSKATSVPLASFASRIMAGETIASLRGSGELPEEGRDVGRFAVKEAVMPWSRFPGADSVLGPEMKSTGEVMGIDATFPVAYAKTRQAIDYKLPRAGRVFVSVCDRDKRAIAPVAMALVGLGYQLVATAGTAKTLRAAGLACEVTKRLSEGHPNIVDEIEGGDIAFIINTPQGNGARGDGSILRSEAVNRGITCVTALSATTALVQAIAAVRDTTLDVYALQDLP